MLIPHFMCVVEQQTNNLPIMKTIKFVILGATAMFLAASCRGTSSSTQQQQYQPAPSYSSK